MSQDAQLREAGALVVARKHAAALETLWTILERPQLRDDTWNEALEMFLRAAAQSDSASRVAATIAIYQKRRDFADKPGNPARDRARVLEASGQAQGAAALYVEAGDFAHAAFQSERAKDFSAALSQWKLFLNQRSKRLDPYTRALATVNLARVTALTGDKKSSRAHIIEAIRLIESTAAHFESTGLRERAFDCYQVLLSLGRDAAFENLAEGYLNCIRILRDDHLRTYVLQYYEDFQRTALERGEFQAAATLFREAAAYCRTQRLSYAAHYLKQAADAHVSTAMAYQRKSASPEIVENAYLAAIECFADLGLFSRVRAVYSTLADLEISAARRARYQALATRLSNERDEPQSGDPFPSDQKSSMAYPDVWRLDVLEWELNADVAETMGDILLDPSWPEETRRRALVCRLRAQMNDNGAHATQRVDLCRYVGATESYPALALVERYAVDESADVRAAAMRALTVLYFKRSFIALRSCLDDEVSAVRADAEKALAKLYFPHAFDPLRRIYRETKRPAVKQLALRSIGRISTREAADFLVDVLVNEQDDVARIAAELISQSRNPLLDEVLRSSIEEADDSGKQLLQSVAAKRPRR